MYSRCADNDGPAAHGRPNAARSHSAIAEAFGCQSQLQVQRVLLGDIDVLEGESFVDRGKWPSVSILLSHRMWWGRALLTAGCDGGPSMINAAMRVLGHQVGQG